MLALVFAAIAALTEPVLATVNSTARQGVSLPITCKMDFLRSYMLKGYPVSNDVDRFVICPSVNSTCCSKRDQLYIFHYLTELLPQRLRLVDSKRNMLLARLKRLHNRIVQTDLSFPGNSTRSRFCSQEGRRFMMFEFNRMYSNYIKISLKWREEIHQRTSTFYCLLCDAKNHQFFDVSPRVTVDRKYCESMITQNSESINFWSKQLMDYLTLLQNVVDCNHYEESFNITFYNQKKLNEAKDTSNCLKNMRGEFMIYCRKTCERLGISTLSNFLDGDLMFLERTLNIFEKFNFNREIGMFYSVRTRRMYRRFQEMREISLDHQNGTFREAILNATAPVDITMDPVSFLTQQLSIPLPRTLHLMNVNPQLTEPPKERRLTLQSQMEESMASQPPTQYELQHRRPSNPNSVYITMNASPHTDVSLVRKLNKLDMFLKDGRRLQGVGAAATNGTSNGTSNSTSNSTSSKVKIRTPKTLVNQAELNEYNEIGIENRTFYDPRMQPVLALMNEMVYPVMIYPINIDLIPRVTADEGVNPTSYNLLPLDIEMPMLMRMIFGDERIDKLCPKIENLINGIPATFRQDLKDFLDMDLKISPNDYLIPAFEGNGAGQTAPRRLLRLLPAA